MRFLIPAVILLSGAALAAEPPRCRPTPPDQLGPFYEPGAPVRGKVGEGYSLAGSVLSTECRPLVGARIEVWLAGPDGRYDDRYRATLFSGPAGAYRFESSFPPPYGGRPPHIHLRVSAPGFRTLVTQHYPEAGKTGARFDLVLVPSL